MVSICPNCDKKFKENDSLFCLDCFKVLVYEVVLKIKPSTIKINDISTIIPEILTKRMPDFLVKDFDEMLSCLMRHLWTASVLMAARILESQLKLRIVEDLEIKREPRTISDCLTILTALRFPEWGQKFIDDLRDIRNKAMHSKTRFSSKKSIGTCQKVVFIVAMLYNTPITRENFQIANSQ